MEIKNIIFDLGGVLLNIDYHLTTNAFRRLGVDSTKGLYTQSFQSQVFDRYEKGEISSRDFILQIKDLLPAGVTREEIITAWNAMILDFPKERLEMLMSIKEKFQTVLLSNTNEIHIHSFYKSLQTEHGISSLENHFKTVYFSYLMGMRKPEPEIFLKVCAIEHFKKEETLFIDDSVQHIESANKIGLHTHLLDVKNENVIDFLSYQKLL